MRHLLSSGAGPGASGLQGSGKGRAACRQGCVCA